MAQLTNLVVNNTPDNILKSFGYSDDEIEKARHGVYSDTTENRRLKRVGQEYGKAGQKEEPSGKKPKKEDKPTEQRGKKEQEAGKKGGKAKEELFSKNGMLDDKGNMNSKSEHVKRMYELEKKVDNGSATSEEKKEYATLRNQSKNEKDRYVHEGRKKLGVEEDEPKYKTVDERRKELIKQKEANAQPKDELTQKKEAAMKDSKVSSFIGCFDGMAEMAMDSNEEVMELLDMGYTPNSPRVQREIRKNMLERNDFGEDIMYAVRKYGVDAVKSLLVEKNSSTDSDFMDEKFANELITNATLKEREENNSEQSLKNKTYNDVTEDDKVIKQKKVIEQYKNDIRNQYKDIIDKLENFQDSVIEKLKSKGVSSDKDIDDAKKFIKNFSQIPDEYLFESELSNIKGAIEGGYTIMSNFFDDFSSNSYYLKNQINKLRGYNPELANKMSHVFRSYQHEPPMIYYSIRDLNRNASGLNNAEYSLRHMTDNRLK